MNVGIISISSDRGIWSKRNHKSNKNGVIFKMNDPNEISNRKNPYNTYKYIRKLKKRV